MNDPITRREALGRIGLLVGSALSASTASAILAGCRPERAADGYAFRALDRQQQELTGALVDLIIPDTDTPGAGAAGVPEFIDMLLTDWMEPEERERFLSGLADVDAHARQQYGEAFLELGSEGQIALLTILDRESYTEERYFQAPPTFFGMLKDLTLAGYYTSEVGATRELQWIAAPGRYVADAPLSEVGRSWA